jgi:catechol 2,3-dioxygenase
MTQLRKRDVGSSVSGLRSVHFGVVEFEKTLEFFVKDWGLSNISASNGTAYLRATGTAPYVVALHRTPRTEVLRIDLNAPDRSAVDSIHRRLAARGAAGLSEPAALPEFGGGYGLRVRDIEGRPYLVVAEDQGNEALSAIDLPRKLSHVVLNTKDAPALTEFFEDGLGFRLVDRTQRIHFLNCNSDHHSLALLPSDQSTLNHVAFEMDSFDALMRGIGRLRGNGHDIGWGVGRHGPGNNIFVYFVGPEILPLEYTAEVQQIDDTYRVGAPEDWKPVPGRMDQWGVTGAPTPAMKQAEHTIGFAETTL